MARHKAFNQEAVLDKAMEYFWSHGYEATSMQDLVEHMGINRGSLYDTYGDKHALFQASLDRYLNGLMLPFIQVLEGTGSGKQAIEQVFDGLVQSSLQDKAMRGCFMTNTAVAMLPHDKILRTKIVATFKRIEQAFHRALLRAQQAKEISKKDDLRSLAQYLVSSIQGLLVMRKVTRDTQTLHAISRMTLRILE